MQRPISFSMYMKNPPERGTFSGFWAQLFERRLALTRGQILTRNALSFYEKHSLG